MSIDLTHCKFATATQARDVFIWGQILNETTKQEFLVVLYVKWYLLVVVKWQQYFSISNILSAELQCGKTRTT